MKKLYLLSFAVLLVTSKAAVAMPTSIVVHNKQDTEMFCTVGYIMKGKISSTDGIQNSIERDITLAITPPASTLDPIEKVVLLVSDTQDALNNVIGKSLMSLRTNRSVEFKAWSASCTGTIECTVFQGRIGTFRIRVDQDAKCPSALSRVWKASKKKELPTYYSGIEMHQAAAAFEEHERLMGR